MKRVNALWDIMPGVRGSRTRMGIAASKCLMGLLIVCFGAPATHGQTGAQPDSASWGGLKGVFIGTESDAAHAGIVGRLGVQLIRHDMPQLVRLDHPFVSGDKFRFEVSANRDGWLYVYHKSPTGEPKLLWPRRSQGGALTQQDVIAVQARRTYVVPASPQVFVFNEEAQTETFYVAITSTETPPRLTALEMRTPESRSEPETDTGGNQIVQFRVRRIGSKGQEGYLGLRYLSPRSGDPYVYFSVHREESTDLTMIEFQLQHD